VVRGEMKDSFIGTHPGVAKVDKFLGWALISCMLAIEGASFLGSLYFLLKDGTALALVEVSSNVCSLSIAVLAFILWHTFCYYDPKMRKFMTTSTRVTPNGFMKSGFVPVPAAASVGLLLFVTSAFVSTSVQPGSMLQSKSAGVFLAWLPQMTCTACSVEDSDYGTSWTARLHRSAPWQGVDIHQATQADVERSADRYSPGSCFNAGYEFGQSDVIDAKTGKDKDIPNFITPEGDTDGRLCVYHCASWQTFKLQTILGSMGSITVGAGIVVVITEKVSSTMGIKTVHDDTAPEKLDALLTSVGPSNMWRKIFKPIQASMFFSAVPLFAFGYLLKYVLVLKIDSDGFFTVDYWTTYALLYSVAMVTFLRLWHPYECRPQIYTRKIWNEGVDTFMVKKAVLDLWDQYYGKGQFKKIKDVGEHLVLVQIDLYQWMHLRGEERCALLIDFVRRPGKECPANSEKLVTVAPTKVKLEHEVDLGGGRGMTRCEKLICLAEGTEFEMVKWKSETELVATTIIDGKKETLIVDPLEILEKSPAWDLVEMHHRESTQKVTGSLQEQLSEPLRKTVWA